ncbi:MAG: NAD-dependent epimerase/dehydratase family protein [Bacteroidales bacterium]|nr:NAD-dependent epimerase/dehydratase family protein [Bacteroidales bacterium]
MNKVAVTGASGHVGSGLCRELINKRFNVKVLIRKDVRGIQDLNLEIVKGDLLDISSLEELCTDVEIVFHLAAQIAINGKNVNEVYKTNVEGTKNLINICIKKGIKRLVYFSSIHALSSAPLDEPLNENRQLVESSRTIYDISKADGERSVIEAVKEGLDAVILNPTAIIGPYDFKPSYLGQALIKLYLNKLPMLVPGGYNWVDVRDVTNATISAAIKGRSGERYILSGTWLSLKDLSLLLEKVTGNKTPKIVCPTAMAKLALPFIKIIALITKEHPLYTKNSLDILLNCNRNIVNAKAKKELGFNPRPLEKTISDTIDWYKANSYIRV